MCQTFDRVNCSFNCAARDPGALDTFARTSNKNSQVIQTKLTSRRSFIICAQSRFVISLITMFVPVRKWAQIDLLFLSDPSPIIGYACQ